MEKQSWVCKMFSSRRFRVSCLFLYQGNALQSSFSSHMGSVLLYYGIICLTIKKMFRMGKRFLRNNTDAGRHEWQSLWPHVIFNKLAIEKLRMEKPISITHSAEYWGFAYGLVILLALCRRTFLQREKLRLNQQITSKVAPDKSRQW